MRTFIDSLPKAELHVHIEGTMEPEWMFEFAERNNVSLRFDSVEDVRAAYRFSNLQNFLDIYYEGARVLHHERDFFDLTWAYLERAHRDNVRHAEIFFDPQTHTRRGVPFAEVVSGIRSALQAAENDLEISSRLIMCFLRHLSVDAAEEALDQALPHLDHIVAVGLDSSEVGHPPRKFASTFDRARAEGLLTVAHAGEEGPPDYIRQALDFLHVSRIDHGVRCTEDPDLVDRLRREQIPLTVCPLSNVKLRVFDRTEDHNLKELLDAGLCVTVNSDDPAYFDGYINDNFHAVQQALDLSRDDVVKMVANSFRASFIEEPKKRDLLDELDDVLNR